MYFFEVLESVQHSTPEVRTPSGTQLPSGMRLPKWSADVVIRTQRPDEHSKMTAPYLYVQSRFGMVPWIPTQIEMFADDWELVQ